MHSQNILHTAVEKLQQTTGIPVSLQTDAKHPDCPELKTDTLLSIALDGKPLEFAVATKRHLTSVKAHLTLEPYHVRHIPALLATDYINPKLAEQLKNQGSNFIDAAGNAYINQPPLFIYITGNKPETPQFAAKANRAFQSTGLKLLFVLLCKPKLANANYRELSQTAGISLGAVGSVINDLQAQTYLVQNANGQRQLRNIAELLNRWVVAYAEKLRPKLVIGQYKALHENWWENVDLSKFNACWSGEIAADKLTRYLKPAIATLYTRDKPNRLILLNSLKTSLPNQANVDIMEQFWHFPNEDIPTLAPPLLVYADLIATANSRNLEAAKLIHEKYLTQLVRSD
jgi:hypothetical protein